jgi:hypothetical protein
MRKGGCAEFLPVDWHIINMASISFVTTAAYRLAAATAVMTDTRRDKGPVSRRRPVSLPCFKATVPVNSAGKECAQVIGFDVDASIVERVEKACKIGRKVSEICGQSTLAFLPNVAFTDCHGSVHFIRDGSIRKIL